MEKQRQVAANQVTPKPHFVEHLHRGSVLAVFCQIPCFLHNERKFLIAPQNSQHIPHTGFLTNVRSPEKLWAEVMDSSTHWDQGSGKREGKSGEDAMESWEPKRGHALLKGLCWSGRAGAQS